jgi:hypothetical protein
MCLRKMLINRNMDSKEGVDHGAKDSNRDLSIGHHGSITEKNMCLHFVHVLRFCAWLRWKVMGLFIWPKKHITLAAVEVFTGYF